MNFKLNATTIQYGFIALIVILVGGIIGISLLAQSLMAEKARSTDHYKIDAEIAQEEIVRLQQLQTTLKNDRAIIDKTAKIVAESQSYEFQDQVITDLNAYARQNNIEIRSFDFGTKPGSAAAQGPAGKTTQQKTTVTVLINKDVPYDSFLRFLKSIEQNITKMQLKGISLQPHALQPGVIQAPTIELEVFLR